MPMKSPMTYICPPQPSEGESEILHFSAAGSNNNGSSVWLGLVLAIAIGMVLKRCDGSREEGNEEAISERSGPGPKSSAELQSWFSA